jgi:large conductance mechanosensitive channel
MIQEFKDFILKGNLVQTAVAFVMGGAFGKVSETFTGIFTGLLGLIGGAPDFSGFKPKGIPFGVFVNAFINLLIVGFVMFLVVKAYNRMIKPKEAPAPEAPPADVALLTEIRDLLKQK